MAQKVYDLDDVLVDPFSPGLRALAGVAASALPGLREAGLRRLDQLRALDPAWEDLYASRERALRSVAVDAGEDAPAAQGGTPCAAPEQALRALARGDLKTVQEISARLQNGGAVASTSNGDARRHDARVHDLTHVFPDETIRKAGRLGLAPVHMESSRLDVDELFRNAWRPRAHRGGRRCRRSGATLGDPAGGPAGGAARPPRDVPGPALRELGRGALPAAARGRGSPGGGLRRGASRSPSRRIAPCSRRSASTAVPA